MQDERTPSPPNFNPALPSFSFDVCDPPPWYAYVADSLVLTGLKRRSGEAYAREVRILVKRFECPPFMLSEENVRGFILERSPLTFPLRIIAPCLFLPSHRSQSNLGIDRDRSGSRQPLLVRHPPGETENNES